MRDALKNLFRQRITLEDNSQFYYTTKPYELTNMLGAVIAVLQEFNFSKDDDITGSFSCTLYKTKEGNWYDMPESNKTVGKDILLSLKLAVDDNACKPEIFNIMHTVNVLYSIPALLQLPV